MSEAASIARPYARALFEVAQEGNIIDSWSQALGSMAAVAANGEVLALLNNPQVGDEGLYPLFVEAAGEGCGAEVKNLVQLMVVNRRLRAMPEVAQQFEQLRSEAESTIEAQLITAKPVNDEQQAELAEALSKKMGREVTLRTEVNEELIGGAIIRAGDWVIDGSVKAQLESLATAISG